MSQLALVPHVHIAAIRTSWPVSVVWLLLSCIVTMFCTISSVHPEWYVRTDPLNDSYLQYNRGSVLYMLGLVGVCYRWHQTSCHTFGVNFPSTAWQVACVLYVSGCVLMYCCVVLIVFCFCAFGQRQRQATVWCIVYIQSAAVLFQTMALLLYPFILTTHFMRLHCGPQINVFQSATCRLGWAYMMAITGTVLGFYCPLLGKYSSYNVYRSHHAKYTNSSKTFISDLPL